MVDQSVNDYEQPRPMVDQSVSDYEQPRSMVNQSVSDYEELRPNVQLTHEEGFYYFFEPASYINT